MRRAVPLRLKVALAGLAGLGLAWLIPKTGGAPEPSPTPTATDRPGITAVQLPLDQIPEGVSFRRAGEVRVFLRRTGEEIVAFLGRSTEAENGPVWWCANNSSFEDEGGDVRYGADGRLFVGDAPRDLDRVRVLVSGDTTTIFPDDVTQGEKTSPPTPSAERLPAPCTAAERLG